MMLSCDSHRLPIEHVLYLQDKVLVSSETMVDMSTATYTDILDEHYIELPDRR